MSGIFLLNVLHRGSNILRGKICSRKGLEDVHR